MKFHLKMVSDWNYSLRGCMMKEVPLNDIIYVI